jgi:hypothetical protein
MSLKADNVAADVGKVAKEDGEQIDHRGSLPSATEPIETGWVTLVVRTGSHAVAISGA